MKLHRSLSFKIALSLLLLVRAGNSLAGALEDCFHYELDMAAERVKIRQAERKTPTKKGAVVVQSGASLSELYVSAQAAKTQFDQTLGKIAHQSDSQAITARLKKVDRATAKMEKKLHGDHSQITDILRGTIICDNMSDVQRVKEAIAAQFPDYSFRDRFEKPKSNGYRDLQATVLVPSSDSNTPSHWAEIQIHLRSLYKAKASQGDALYHRWRVLQEAATHRELTPAEKTDVISLKVEEKKLYDDAWSNAIH